MKPKQFLLLGMIFTLTSCGHLLDGRSFIGEMERESDPFLVPGRDFRTVAGDSGRSYRSAHEIMERTPANYRSKEEYEYQRSLMTELTIRENQLNERERLRYQQVAAYLPSESEKIYYLSLTPYERESYIAARTNYSDRRSGRAPASLQASSSFDQHQSTGISMGMSKDHVLGVFGHPHRVDVAGNPRLENERWAFVENGRVRYVYFEGGRVQGWALD